jgi:hypothetical protein
MNHGKLLSLILVSLFLIGSVNAVSAFEKSKINEKITILFICC